MLLLQYKSGIYGSELSHEPDESAHVVTSLMIHDYVTKGIGTSPMKFAEDYYIHYPKVAFGVWPPMFHATAAVWMLLFGRTHTALLVFVAFQCALCAATLAMFARRLLPPLVAAALGVTMILLPAFQDATSMMMVDVFVTMMVLWALFLMIEFFRTEDMKTAVWWGVVTSLAMLAKANANSLIFCGIFMLLLTRRFAILKRPPIYVAGLIVLILGIPWQALSTYLMRNAVVMTPLTPGRFWMMLSFYTAVLVHKLTLPVLLIAVGGLLVVLVPLVFGKRETPVNLTAAAAVSLVLGIIVFHCISPTVPDDRYMLSALPMMLLFAAFGVYWAASAIPVPKLSPQMKATVVTILFLGWCTERTFALTRRPEFGFDKTAASLELNKVNNEVVLVCSDSWGEGAFISSMALDDHAGLEHVVLRGSKILSQNPWDLTAYRPNFANTNELEHYLEETPVDAILVDLSGTLWEQDRALLRQTIQENSTKWHLSSEIQAMGERRHLLLYLWCGADHSKIERNIRIRMPFTLGHDLVLKK